MADPYSDAGRELRDWLLNWVRPYVNNDQMSELEGLNDPNQILTSAAAYGAPVHDLPSLVAGDRSAAKAGKPRPPGADPEAPVDLESQLGWADEELYGPGPSGGTPSVDADRLDAISAEGAGIQNATGSLSPDDLAIIRKSVVDYNALSAEEAARLSTIQQEEPQDFALATTQVQAEIDAGIRTQDMLEKSSWIYSEAGGVVGTVSSAREDLLEIYDVALDLDLGTQLDALLMDTEAEAGETEEDRRIRVVTEMLQNGNTPENQFILSSTFSADNRWRPTVTIDGVSNTVIQQLMPVAGDGSTALLIAKAAMTQDIDPVAFGHAWSGFKERMTDSSYLGAAVRDIEETATTPANAGAAEQIARATYASRKKSPYTGVGRLAREYRMALDKYGDSHLLAQVAVQAPNLAEKMYLDPWSLSRAELERVVDLVGGLENPDGTPRGDLATGQTDWMAMRLSGVGETRAVDTMTANEAARTLAQSWGLPVDDATLNTIASGFSGQLASTFRETLGNPFKPEQLGGELTVEDIPTSPTAWAANALRQLPAYQRLYRGKTTQESEEQYYGRFASKAQSVLGDENPEVIQAAMSEGDTGEVARYALSSGIGWKSSTFQQRAASIAEMFRTMT